MSFRRWDDAGLAWTVEVATNGDFRTGGTPTDMPLDSGGPSGAPVGWTPYTEAGGTLAQANFTTADNVFSVSNALTTITGYAYGALLSYPVVAGKRYLINLMVRQMEGKEASTQYTGILLINGSDVIVKRLETFATAGTSWERMAIPTGVIPAGVVRIQFSLAGRQVDIPVPRPINWGVQFTDVVIADLSVSATPIEWRDITCDVRAITTRHGREKFTERYDVGTTVVELNNDDGEYAYRDPHPFGFGPGRRIRGTVYYGSAGYAMFYGIIDSIKDSYSLDGHAVSTINAMDVSSLLSTVKVPTVPHDVALMSGQRIGLLLDVAGWAPVAFRSIDVGEFTTQQIVANGRSIREEIGVTADSEGGYFFADRTGNMVYRDRTWSDWSTYLNTVTATILARTDDANLDVGIDGVVTMAGAPILCANQLETEWNRSRIINYMELANAGGTVERFEDEVSQRAQGIGTYSRTDYVNDIAASNANGYLATRANDLMDGYAAPVLRVNRIAFRPDEADDWVWSLSVFLNWLVRIWYAHPLNDWGFALATHVQSIEHRVTVDDWLITMAVDQPVSFVDAPVVPQSHWDDGIARWDDGITVWS